MLSLYRFNIYIYNTYKSDPGIPKLYNITTLPTIILICKIYNKVLIQQNTYTYKQHSLGLRQRIYYSNHLSPSFPSKIYTYINWGENTQTNISIHLVILLLDIRIYNYT